MLLFSASSFSIQLKQINIRILFYSYHAILHSLSFGQRTLSRHGMDNPRRPTVSSVGRHHENGNTNLSLHSDGVYEVFTDVYGTSIHDFIAPITPAFIPRGAITSRGNHKRTLQGSNAVGCGGTYFADNPSNQTNANNAVQSLKNQCVGGATGGGAVAGNADRYSVAGQCVAYFCNFSSMQNTCYSDEVADAVQTRISGQCGAYESGWDIVIDRAAQYGYEYITANFCGRGR